MGAKADHDLWGHALAMESRYGDSGPDVLADRIAELRSAGDEREADFWSLVADCLIELHAIRYPGRRLLPGINDMAPYAERGRGFPGIRKGGDLAQSRGSAPKRVEGGFSSRS